MFPWLEALVPIPEMSAIFVSAKNALHRENPFTVPVGGPMDDAARGDRKDKKMMETKTYPEGGEATKQGR
jgi:hypothetical protein